jgi:hypothetical protein
MLKTKSHPPRRTKPRDGLFLDQHGMLLVPNDDMRLVHNSSKPSVILLEAGYSDRKWESWKKRFRDRFPEVVEWLYNDQHSFPGGLGEPDTAMLAFRQKATFTAIAKASKRPTEMLKELWLPKTRGTVSAQLILMWRRKYQGKHKAEYPLFERWLLRGEESPGGLRVASENQVALCNSWWDYVGHCKANKMAVGPTYATWIEKRIIPDLRWLKWLFDGPASEGPEGALVIPPDVQRIRTERSARRILHAAGLDKSKTAVIPARWKKDKKWKEAFLAICETVSHGNSPQSCPAWDHLPARTRNNMAAYGMKAKLSACCERAEVPVKKVVKLLTDAERIGAKYDLEHFLRLDALLSEDKPGGKWRISGLVAPKIFVPPPRMPDFQNTAMKAKAAQPNGSRYLEELPALDLWFKERTKPFEEKTRKRILPETFSPTALRPARGNVARPVVNGHVTENSSIVTLGAVPPEENNTPPSLSGPTESPEHETKLPFIPSAFQERILKALQGKALTADNLQTKLDVDRKALYRDGLSELKKHGKIMNNRRVGGYFRADAPPPKLAEFLGENIKSETEAPTKETEAPAVI